MTPEQKQGQVDKLAAWRDAGVDYAGALSNAAINGTQGLFLSNQPKFANKGCNVSDLNDFINEGNIIEGESYVTGK